MGEEGEMRQEKERERERESMCVSEREEERGKGGASVGRQQRKQAPAVWTYHNEIPLPMSLWDSKVHRLPLSVAAGSAGQNIFFPPCHPGCSVL